MHIRYSAFAQKLVFFGVVGTLVAGVVQPVSADIPLPIVDIVPTSSFSTTENAGNTHNPDPPNGDIEINGTATLPLVLKGLSASYDRISLGAFDSALAGVPIGGETVYAGAARDLLQNFRLDYHNGHFNVEGGFASRYRRCCPADSFEWHKGFLGVTYATPSISILNGGFFVLGVTLNDYHHTINAESAPVPPGYSLAPGQIYTTQQFVSGIIPIDKKSGVRIATTFLWGALDYFEKNPFPSYYDVFVFSGTKQVNPNFGVSATLAQVHQRIQGYPFPPPGFISTSALNVDATFHINFADFLPKPAPPAPAGRSGQPGVPNGPGGPAQPGATQGGTVSPAPAMPGASPAPMMSAAPAPEMSASPAPMMSGAPASPSPAP
jgi:hypothetical protein